LAGRPTTVTRAGSASTFCTSAFLHFDQRYGDGGRVRRALDIAGRERHRTGDDGWPRSDARGSQVQRRERR
jgi:hypothetical protein